MDVSISRDMMTLQSTQEVLHEQGIADLGVAVVSVELNTVDDERTVSEACGRLVEAVRTGWFPRGTRVLGSRAT